MAWENDTMVEKTAKKMLTLFLASTLTIAFNVTATSPSPGNIMIAVYGSTPTIDGSIEDGEWGDASTATVSVTGGANCTVYAKQDSVNLYIGFSIPDVTYNGTDCCIIIFDANNDGGASLQVDDMWLAVSRIGAKGEYNVTAGGWFPTTVSGWAVQASSASSGWQCEYNVTYFKVDVTAGTNKTLGVMFLIVDKDVEMGWYVWPSTASILKPMTWGDMTSDEYNWQAPADTTPPTVSIVSLENKTYFTKDVPLTFTVSEFTSWIGYSLDDQANVTITGNTTLYGLFDGSHGIIVYANATTGNTAASQIIFFSISTQQAEPFPMWIVAAILIMLGVGASLLVYFLRVKKTTIKVKKWRRCPRCGTLNLPTHDFCDKCGASL